MSSRSLVFARLSRGDEWMHTMLRADVRVGSDDRCVSEVSIGMSSCQGGFAEYRAMGTGAGFSGAQKLRYVCLSRPNAREAPFSKRVFYRVRF